MPVTGNEETGVKPMTRQSSDYIAGVPIKKRRFPLFRPPSPVSDEPSSIQPENYAEQKEQSSPSQGPAISNASVATTSSGLADANKKPISEECKANSDVTNVTVVQKDPNYSRVKLEEQSLTIHSACQVTLGKTELQLAPNEEALALNVGKEMCSKEKVEGKRKAEIPTRNTELSLGIKEHLVPALAGESSNGNVQNQDSLGPVYLNLSLSKGNGSTQCKSDDVKLNNSEQRCANRANWDLNTTMDAWEGSVSDAAAGKISADRFNTTDGTQDIKPLICSTGMIGAVVTSEKQSLVESARGANFTISSEPSCQQYKSDDSLRLGLSPSFHQLKVSPDPSRLSVKEDSRRAVPNISFPGLVMPNTVNYRIVKPEPFDDSNKLNCKGAKSNGMRLLENGTIKRELGEQYQPPKSSNISTLKSVDPKSIKAEPVHEANQETLKTIEGTLLVVGKQVLQGLSNPSCAMAMPATLQMCSAGEPSCSTELTIARDVTNLLEQQSSYTKDAHLNGGEVPREACESGMQVASEKVAISVGNDGEEPIASGMTDIVRAEDGNANDSERGRLLFMSEQASDLRGSGEGSVSDEEKINISADMLEEDSYGSDCESDGNHPMDTERDGAEDDYEDGEVREPLLHTAMEEPVCEKKELVHVDHGDSDNKKDFVGQLGDDHPTSSHVEEKDAKTEDPSETNNKDMKDLHTMKGISVNGADEVTFLQESLAVENLIRGAEMKMPITAIQIKPLDRSGSKDCLKEEILSFEQTTKVSEGTVTTVTQGTEENVKQIDLGQENDMALTKTDTSANGDDAAKDANSGGNRSRIINLSRAANASFPGKTRYFPGSRYLPSGAGRERLPDVALEGDKLHPRGRDELYIDGPHKFSRERHQYQSPRNSRVNSLRGRGRITRINGDWNDRDFPPEFYNGSTGFRVPRHKYASAVADADNDLEYNSYNIAPDNAFVGTGRGGRKHFNDEGANFRHIPSRRRSPGGRDGPAARGGIQMIRRVPRNVSPSRCIGEDGSELVALRHTEKFMRVFPDDNMDAMFTRPQPPYEGDGHFPRGNRNFPTVQRRTIPQNRSKSPIRSRSRSPGPWPSPRRRSQDGFGGHQELTHRRSPPLFRMRSPDRSCFPDLLVRRHGSPSYLSRPSNDLRDIDSGRDHGHPRSVVPNRSPSGRILLRNRRFDAIDLRERTDNDEYFGGPMHTGRLHELGNDANSEERRRFGERRGPVRSFRPPYNGGNSENFHLNSEDGPRPFRFCPEDDSEFQERGNFDRRIINKNRPGNAPRRTRSIEEQEANYRHGGQEWHDEGFDEISRVKRKRF